MLLLCAGQRIQAQETTTVPHPGATMVDTTPAGQMMASLTDFAIEQLALSGMKAGDAINLMFTTYFTQ